MVARQTSACRAPWIRDSLDVPRSRHHQPGSRGVHRVRAVPPSPRHRVPHSGPRRRCRAGERGPTAARPQGV